MADLQPLQILNFSRQGDSLNIFLCFSPKLIPHIHSTNSSDEFEIGQDSDRNQVMAAKVADYRPLFFLNV